MAKNITMFTQNLTERCWNLHPQEIAMQTMLAPLTNAETNAPAETLYLPKESLQTINKNRQTACFSPRVSFKKTLLIALLLLITALSFAEIYTLGGDNTYNTAVPLNTMMAYSWSKSLISAADIQTAGLNGVAAITAIGFYPAGDFPIKTFPNQEIYLRNTDLAVQNNICPNTEDYSLAYSGDVTFQGGEWNTFMFSMPFIWDGLSNIEIVWLNNHGVSYTGSFFFRNDHVADYATAHKFSSSAFPTGNGSLDYIRPYLQIHAVQSTSPLLTIYPTALDFGEMRAGEAAEPLIIQAANCGQETLNLSEDNISISGSGADLFSFDTSNLPAALEIGERVQIPVNVSTDTVGDLSATLTISYAGASHDVSLSANIIPAGTVEIGDGTNHQLQPFDIGNRYGTSVALYTMDDIGTVGMIESIGWYCASPSNQSTPYKIYMGPTLHDEIPSGYQGGYYGDIIQGLTLVNQGIQTFDSAGWYMFDLDTPFAYSGENIMVLVESNIGGTGAANCPRFRYTDTFSYTHGYWRSQYQLPHGSANLNSWRPNIRLILDDITIDPQLSVSPQSIDFGTIFSGVENGPINLTLSNIGIGTIVLNETDVSLSGAHADMFSYDDSVFPLTIFTDHSVTIPLYVMSNEVGNVSANFIINFADEEFVVDLSANVTVHENSFFAEIGDGTEINSETEAPAPYGTYYRSFREQYLVTADELHAQNSGSGIIESIAFNVANLNDVNPMRNYKIRLKHTNQEELSTTFELGDYIEVFQTPVFTPQEGWNTHLFQIPFAWNGTSNILVDVATSLSISGSENASTYYTTYPHDCTLRQESNNHGCYDAKTGNTSTDRPNMKLFMQERNFMDIAAISIAGNKLPSIDTGYDYTVRICNLSPEPVSGYQVNLVMQRDHDQPLIVDTIDGISLQALEYADVVLSWTPAIPGDAVIYGKVSFNQDENLYNNNTPPLGLEVMETSYQLIQLGEETITNHYTSGPSPYGNHSGAFRQQFLYTADEIADRIDTLGLISGIAFNVLDIEDCLRMVNYRIRLKHTTQTSLTNEFEAGDYTEVFVSPSLVLTNGWNTHYFTRPFFYNGVDNVLVDILTDFSHDNISNNPRVYYSNTSFNSSIRFESYSVESEDATLGRASNSRSNTRLYFETDGMGSLTGTVLEDVYPVPNMIITLEDTVFKTTTNQDGIYHFPYIYAGTHTLTASKNCYTSVSHTIVIEENEQTVQDFSVSGTPEFSVSDSMWDFGYVALGNSESKDFYIINSGGDNLLINSITLSGSDAFTITEMPTLPILLRSDEYTTLGITFEPDYTGIMEANIIVTDDQNNSFVLTNKAGLGLVITNHGKKNRDSHGIDITGTGVSALTIGEPLYSNRVPFDFSNDNSVFQVIFSNDELNNFSGTITGIKLYNHFSEDLYDKPVRIWMASTPLSDLSAGWISSDDMTLVFDGAIDFPAGENIISIDFPQHFLFAQEENLVLLFHKPVYQGRLNQAFFKSFSARENSTRNRADYSDFYALDPANMYGGTLGNRCPMITLEGIHGRVGRIQGHVCNTAGIPLSEVSIALDEDRFTTSDEDGFFSLNNVWQGDHTLSFSRYDHLNQSMQIAVEEDITHELEIFLEESPLVSITGTIIAGDTAEGLSGAEITLSGCMEYNAITNDLGEFIIDSGVYAQNAYNYQITAEGYAPQTGTINLDLQDYDMGTITLYGIPYAPEQVLAELSINESLVYISWDVPTPDTRGISKNKVNFKLAQKSGSNESRALLNYRVYRLKSGQELLEHNWILLAEELTETSIEDTDWDDLSPGLYLWAVKAFYSADNMSEPVFSNTIEKGNTLGKLHGIVYRTFVEDRVEGVIIDINNEYRVITPADGSFSLFLPEGAYHASAHHHEYGTINDDNIFITAGEDLWATFVYDPISTEDVVEIAATALHSNYPNPFNPETTISYDLKAPAEVRLSVYNLKGQLVKTLVNTQQSAGKHNVVFDARDDRGNKLSSGIYFYRLIAGDYVKTRKMMLIE